MLPLGCVNEKKMNGKLFGRDFGIFSVNLWRPADVWMWSSFGEIFGSATLSVKEDFQGWPQMELKRTTFPH